jgi:peroxiredoxin
MSQRLVARTGLASAILVLTLAMGVLGRQAMTNSHPSVEVGKTAPQFTLRDTTGHAVSLADYRGQAVVLFFGSDVCPMSQRYAERLGALAKEYAGDGRVKFIAVNSNTHARAAKVSALRLIDSDRIPTLLDPLAELARSFGATVTPTFCVIDAGGNLCYAGAFDNGEPDAGMPGRYVARAVEQTVGGIPCVITSTQAFGRSIAWVK